MVTDRPVTPNSRPRHFELDSESHHCPRDAESSSPRRCGKSFGDWHCIIAFNQEKKGWEMHYQILVQKLAELLGVDQWREEDSSQNGLQVQPGKGHEEVRKVAVAVDGNLETFELAMMDKRVDLLVVHHGLFWKNSPLLTGWYYRRVKTLLDAGVGLYACHLPLDAHPTLGNNAQLAKVLGLKKVQSLDVGVIGDLAKKCTLDQVVASLKFPLGQTKQVWSFGEDKFTRVAIISGGGGGTQYLALAQAAGAELYLTGEVGHQTWQYAKENQLNVLGLGHYWTETFGPKAVQEYIEKEWGLETVWLAAPTGC